MTAAHLDVEGISYQLNLTPLYIDRVLPSSNIAIHSSNCQHGLDFSRALVFHIIFVQKLTKNDKINKVPIYRPLAYKYWGYFQYSP